MSHLKGMMAITKYANRSESTILKWVRELGFPAVKIKFSAVWESDSDLVDQWRKDQINGELEAVKRPEIETLSKRPAVKKMVNRTRK